MFISETHFTERSYLKVPNYALYYTDHPDGTAHGGAAILIRQNIKHYESRAFAQDNIQDTSVTVQGHRDELTLTAVYFPSKHNNKRQHYENVFKTLDSKFIARGDYNAKNV
jgi:exonuclease III